jgi:HEAT repeat protein
LKPRGRIHLALLLAGSDRRSIGASNEAAAAVRREPRRAAELVQALGDSDPVLRMRAADALEKACRIVPEAVQPYTAKLLKLANQAGQPEVQWHLAQLLRHLVLQPRQRAAAIRLMKGYLRSPSVIVRVEALTTLAALAEAEPRLGAGIRRELLRRRATGTAAERARARRLIGASSRLRGDGHGGN